MSDTIIGSKSLLARLLAEENLIVEHKKVDTAMFLISRRILTLPIWKEMSDKLYNRLVGHEVGHALYTPEEYEEICEAKGLMYSAFLNIIEDGRVDKKIKRKYPGLRKSFSEGFDDIIKVKPRLKAIVCGDGKGLYLIDRINFTLKAPHLTNYTFTDEEAVYLKRAQEIETWEEVITLTNDIFHYCVEVEENKKDTTDNCLVLS